MDELTHFMVGAVITTKETFNPRSGRGWAETIVGCALVFTWLWLILSGQPHDPMLDISVSAALVGFGIDRYQKHAPKRKRK